MLPVIPPLFGTVTAAPFLNVPESTVIPISSTAPFNCSTAAAVTYAQDMGSVQPIAGKTSLLNISCKRFTLCPLCFNINNNILDSISKLLLLNIIGYAFVGAAIWLFLP